MKILMQQGEISLIEYDGGNYSVDFSGASVGGALLMTRGENLALEYYLAQIKKSLKGGEAIAEGLVLNTKKKLLTRQRKQPIKNYPNIV